MAKFLAVLLLLVASTWALPFTEEELQLQIQDALIEGEGVEFPTPKEMILGYGYPFELHTVTTDDGYVLSMHRIPPGKAGTEPNGQVVLLMHGLLCSSADWLVTGPGKAFAFLLADRGYDVWLGNARGNKFSREHTKLQPDSKEFWNFSWHEIGMFDLPAMIDYASDETNTAKIHYVGHSQGTTAFFVLMSMRPKYDKIGSAHMLSPVAYMSNIDSPFGLAIFPIANALGNGEFLPSSEMMVKGGYYACRDESPLQAVCANVLFLIAGFDSEQLNRTILPNIFANVPAGASVKQLKHYGQLVISGKFRQYDYGLLENMKRYKFGIPPSYPVENISCPLNLYYSRNDWLAAVEDVEMLAGRLNKTNNYIVSDPKFNHLDFLWATDANKLLYEYVISQMKSNA